MDVDDLDDLMKMLDKIFNESLWGGYMYNDDLNYNPHKQWSKFGKNIPHSVIYKKENATNNNIIDFEDEKCIYITVELKGVNEEQLNVVPKQDSLYISIGNGIEKLEREYPLPCKINPKTAIIKFNNGILDITLKKKKEKKNEKEAKKV